jgi:hypothetical protein
VVCWVRCGRYIDGAALTKLTRCGVLRRRALDLSDRQIRLRSSSTGGGLANAALAEIDVAHLFVHSVNLGGGTLAVSAAHAPVEISAVEATFPEGILRAVLDVPRRVVELDIPGRLALGVRLACVGAHLLGGGRVGQGYRRDGDRYRRSTRREQWRDEASGDCHVSYSSRKLNVQFPPGIALWHLALGCVRNAAPRTRSFPSSD